MFLALTVEVPVKLISEANTSDHWTVHMRRKHNVQKQLQLALNAKLGHRSLTTPAKVVLTRIGKKLDDDNLLGAFKSVRDKIADAIIPGKRPGRADDSPLIEWEYKQEPRKGRLEGFIVEIYQEKLLDLSKYV